MAHQCLKCGNTYPDGSPQILKGCDQCKGTRFFYTDAPLDDDQRAALGHKADGALDRLATNEAPPPRRIPTKNELPVGHATRSDDAETDAGDGDGEWVHIGSEHLRNVVEDVVRRATDRKPVFRVGAAPPAPNEAPKKTLAEWIREQEGSADPRPADDVVEEASDPQVTDVLDDLMAPEREVAWRDASRPAPSQAAAVDADAEVVYARSDRPRRPPAEPTDGAQGTEAREVPKPVSLAGVEMDAEEDVRMRERARAALDETEATEVDADTGARTLPQPSALPSMSETSGTETSLYPEGQAPETVAIDGEGVYELDVKRLLEKQPIVVHRDGSYSLHLPSLMESLDGAKKQRQ